MERFMVLYEMIYKDLYRLAYYYLGNSQDAEDVVGETVLKAYENFGKLRNEDGTIQRKELDNVYPGNCL